MNMAKKLVCEIVCAAVALCAANAQTNVPPAVSSAPSEPVDAEVVFVLDTTGSMTGLEPVFFAARFTARLCARTRAAAVAAAPSARNLLLPISMRSGFFLCCLM